MLIEHLKREFAERCRKNPAYSLRAFARSLGMDSSTLSSILKGKRAVTLKTARRIVEGLHLSDPNEAHNLLVGTLTAGGPQVTTPDYKELAMEAAEAISSWEHFAILAVLELKEPKATQRAIAERLNIPIGIVMECLERLERLGLVEEGRRGWDLTGKNMATPTQIPSGALRKGLRQNIERALASLESDPVDVRDMTGITMAVSKSRLPEAKKMIQEFRRRLSAHLEGGRRDAVYQLNIQLFPLSQEKR